MISAILHVLPFYAPFFCLRKISHFYGEIKKALGKKPNYVGLLGTDTPGIMPIPSFIFLNYFEVTKEDIAAAKTFIKWRDFYVLSFWLILISIIVVAALNSK